MMDRELEEKVVLLEQRLSRSGEAERLRLRPSVLRIIQTLKSTDQPIPRRLRTIEARLEEDAYDEMFDNMPI